MDHVRAVGDDLDILIDEARLRGPAVNAVGRGGFNLAALSGSVRIEARAAGVADTKATPSVFYLGGSVFDLKTLPDPLQAAPGGTPRPGFPPLAPPQ